MVEINKKIVKKINELYYGPNVVVDDEMLAEELEDRDYYKEVNVFWVPEAARWESLRAQAKQAEGLSEADARRSVELEDREAVVAAAEAERQAQQDATAQAQRPQYPVKHGIDGIGNTLA